MVATQGYKLEVKNTNYEVTRSVTLDWSLNLSRPNIYQFSHGIILILKDSLENNII